MINNNNKIIRETFFPIINLIKNKKYDKALNLLEGLTDKQIDLNFINQLKGLIYLNKKNWKESLLYYQKIPKKKLNFETLNNIGVCFYKLGKFNEASDKFYQSINENKNYISAYENFCVTNKLLGNYDLSIKYSSKALLMSPKNNKLKNNLLDILNFYEPKEISNSIININNQIKKLNKLNNNKKFIQNTSLNKILNQSQLILENNNFILNYPHTQIFKKNTTNLNCERHLAIFEENKIIPKFCFNCFKVQLTLNSVLDLIKLYFYFNNLNLKNNNIRKCIVELRDDVEGNYKGYIFSSSVNEAESIKKIISEDLINSKIVINKIEIKHGCTEYYNEFELYKNISENIVDKIYDDKWENIEKEFDKKNFIEEINKERVFKESINTFNLPDFLIIKNWLIYAKITGDHTYQEVYESEVATNHLTHLELQKINMRNKKLSN